MNLLVRFGWTLWALVPVAIIAFHFGPGQDLAAREAAVRRFNAAVALERVAIDAQAEAYQTHLDAIEARRWLANALAKRNAPQPDAPRERVFRDGTVGGRQIIGGRGVGATLGARRAAAQRS